jgi:transcriptional antiterminator NusG
MLREHWYAVHVISQYENKVKNYIDKVKKERGYGDKVSEVIIPMNTEIKRVQGKKVEKQNKVFPGYVLVKMKLDEDSFNFIRRVPGVTNFVSSSAKKPIALKDSEVKAILDSLEQVSNILVPCRENYSRITYLRPHRTDCAPLRSHR